MKPPTVIAAAVLAGLASAWAHAAPAETGVARQAPLPVATSQADAVRRALRGASRRHEATIAEWIKIASVPALPGQEAERAELLAKLLREAGLPAKVLPDGNVEAVMAGSAPGAPAVIAAHLDALHAPSRDLKITRDEQFLRGPGVLDDASGLAALVAAAQHLAEAGYKPRREVRLLCTVGEETGLVGAKSYVGANPDIAAFVALDGILGAVDYGATGITWLRFRFTGRGGHTLLAARVASPAFAAGRAIAALADLAESGDEPLSVSVLRGGDVPNAIPTEVQFTVDVRSDDAVVLARLEKDIHRLAQAAADREGVRLDVDVLQSLPAARLPGHGRSPLVVGATDILGWLELPASVFPRGSADHNVALLAGIPAIAVGTTVGRHAHAPEEVADWRLLEKGVQQTILLVVLLGEGLTAPARPSAVGE